MSGGKNGGVAVGGNGVYKSLTLCSYFKLVGNGGSQQFGGGDRLIGVISHKCRVVRAVDGAEGGGVHPAFGDNSVHGGRRTAINGSYGGSAVYTAESIFGVMEHSSLFPKTFEALLAVK